MYKLKEYAENDVHFEIDETEVNIYIGSWFLCSVEIKDVSEEAKQWLFEEK